MDEVTLDDIDVMYVESPNGPEGAKAAFDELEAHLPDMRGRKFYGTFQPPDGPYRACVAMQAEDDPKALGLAKWTMPGGRYARRTLDDWAEHIPQIGEIFGAMSREYGERYDPNRPSIEFHRTEKEVVLLLPIGRGGMRY